MKKKNLYKYLLLISLFYPLNSAKADDSIVDLNYVDDSTTNYRFSILNSSDNFLRNTIGLEINRKNKFGAVLSYKNEQGDSKNSDSYQLQINWNF